MKTLSFPSFGLGVNIYGPAFAMEGVTAVSSRRELFAVLPRTVGEEEASGVVLTEARVNGNVQVVAVPMADCRRGQIMSFGGRFLNTSDSRFRDVAGGPIPFLDVEGEGVPALPVVGDDVFVMADVVFSPGYRGCALGGATQRLDRVRLYLSPSEVPADASDDDFVRVEHRTVRGNFYAEPLKVRRAKSWGMMGGSFLHSSDPRFTVVTGGRPLPAYDRVETREYGGD